MLSLKDILNRTESISYSKEINYSQQRGINGKPSLVAGTENLKVYPLTIKLHHSFCKPQNVIDEIEEKIVSCDVIDYFQGSKYIGKYVISKMSNKWLEHIDGVLTAAEIELELLECGDEPEVFEQQTITDDLPDIETLKGKAVLFDAESNPVKKFLGEQNLNIKNNLTGSILNMLTTGSITSLPDAIQAIASGIVSGIISDINAYGVQNIAEIIEKYLTNLKIEGLTEIQQEMLSNFIKDIPSTAMNRILRGF